MFQQQQVIICTALLWTLIKHYQAKLEEEEKTQKKYLLTHNLEIRLLTNN